MLLSRKASLLFTQLATAQVGVSTFGNAVKVVPYFMLGQFDSANLMASAVLMPFAPLATLAGAWVIKRMRAEVFYPFTYTMVIIVAAKLIHDGLQGLG